MQKLRSATAIYEDSETSLQKKKTPQSHLDICWRMMMVTTISPSNRSRGETGSTGGLCFPLCGTQFGHNGRHGKGRIGGL